jgi:hypothetical protein
MNVAGGTITVRDELKSAYFIIGRRKAAWRSASRVLPEAGRAP